MTNNTNAIRSMNTNIENPHTDTALEMNNKIRKILKSLMLKDPNLTFCNVSFLDSHGPSCLNRDDTGMVKDAIFGGTRRLRISSQCRKRAIRRGIVYKTHFGNDASIRSANPEAVVEHLASLPENSGIDKSLIRFLVYLETMSGDGKLKDNVVVAWFPGEIHALAKTIQEELGKKDGMKFGTNNENKNENFVGFIGMEDIEKVSTIFNTAPTPDSEISDENEKVENETVVSGENGSKKKVKKESKNKSAEEYIKKVMKPIKKYLSGVFSRDAHGISPVDAAMSGRMCTGDFLDNVQAALHAGEAITTHTAEFEADWYTAMDDLAEGPGAAHLNSHHFGSGTYYIHDIIDIRTYMENRASYFKTSGDIYSEIADYIDAALSTPPTGKQSKYASYTYPGCVFVEFSGFRSSLENAFEKPVQADSESGFFEPSMKRLQNYWMSLAKGTKRPYKAALFTLNPELVDPALGKDFEVAVFTNVPDFLGWIRRGGEVNE